MLKRLKSRLGITALMTVSVLALALAARPARPAVPARPVDQTEGHLPLQGVTVFVDAGHGGTDGGARAKNSGAWEKDVNLRTARHIRDALEDAEAEVVLSRDSDTEYDRNKRKDLTARLNLAIESKADLLLSIHMNEYRSRKEAGPQVFYRKGREQSRLLAGALQNALIEELQPQRPRAAMAEDYFFLSLDAIPSVLVECGLLSNAAEEKLLLTDAYQQRIAQAVCRGVTEFFTIRQ